LPLLKFQPSYIHKNLFLI